MSDVLLVGCGLWGERVLRDLVELGARVEVAEPDAARRQVAERLGARRAVEQAAAAADCDGIVVATPAATHAELVEALLPSGVPLLVEKPLAVNEADAERLALAAPERIFVGHVWRYHAGVRALAERVAAGQLGRIEWLRSTRANWTSPRNDVDPVWTLAPHDLSIALALLGTLPPPRAAFAERAAGRVVGLLAVLGGAPSLVIEVSTRYADKRRELRVHGSEGVAVLRGADAAELEITRGAPDAPQGRTERYAVRGEPALRRELRAFLEHLRGGPPPPTDVREGVEVVRSLCALRRLAGI